MDEQTNKDLSTNESLPESAEPIVITASAPANEMPPATNTTGGDNKEKSNGESDNKFMAVLAYLGALIIVPLIVAKDKPFVKFHIKQGLVLIIGWALVWAVQMIYIPFNFVAPLLWFALFVLSVIGILNAVGGKEKQLPVVGQYSKYFDEMLN